MNRALKVLRMCCEKQLISHVCRHCQHCTSVRSRRFGSCHVWVGVLEMLLFINLKQFAADCTPLAIVLYTWRIS